MDIPRPLYVPERREMSLLMAFTLMRLKAGIDLQERDRQDKGPEKPKPEAPAPRRDDGPIQVPVEIPDMPKVKEIDRPGGGDEIGPVEGGPEIPVLPRTNEISVPGREMPGGIMH